jgi:hypothetical protein
LTRAALDAALTGSRRLRMVTGDPSALSKFLRILPDHRFADRAPVPPAAPSHILKHNWRAMEWHPMARLLTGSGITWM